MKFLFGKKIFFSISLICTSGCAYISNHPEVEKELEVVREEVLVDVFHESAHLLQERVNQ